MTENRTLNSPARKVDQCLEEFRDLIKDFGGNDKNQLLRDGNIGFGKPDVPEKAFFATVRAGQPFKGTYSDLSVVVFPCSEKAETRRYLISIVVGSNGYEEDYDIAARPWLRRLCLKFLPKTSYVKTDFTDIRSGSGFSNFKEEYGDIPSSLAEALKQYGAVLLAATFFDPDDSEEVSEYFGRYLAIYARVRGWATNGQQRREVNKRLQSTKSTAEDLSNQEKDEVKRLLATRRYVVLQGAPGTGKTYLARHLAEDYEEGNVFFTQFHAETSFSDFISGITPVLDSDTLKYERVNGSLVQAIKRAEDPNNHGKNVLLIIDEINRANLANVLGQVFYLFEPSMAGNSKHSVSIEITPELKLSALPENLYVIATMNSADRSLAVVDFALRRRFAWYTLHPHLIKPDAGMKFMKADFNAIDDIFEKHASDSELNLQPGHAYFLVNGGDDADEIMKDRLRYELMPLLKEYLLEGMLSTAKDDFVGFFRERIQEEMFR